MNVELEPALRVWAGLAEAWFDPTDPCRKRVRAALGLDPDRPIIASGHQARVWHPGIAAKVIALASVADQLDAQALWIIVDTEDEPVDEVVVPVRTDAGVLERRPVLLGGGVLPRAAPFAPLRSLTERAGVVPPPPVPSDAFVDIEEALNARRSSACAAVQMTLAGLDALRAVDPWVRPPDAIVSVSSLSGRGALDDLIEPMRTDAGFTAATFNRAVRDDSAGGVMPLVEHPGKGWELPLWQLGPESRVRVFASQLGDVAHESLAPRALSMTAAVRAWACDLFIHGRGGRVYDRATEAWMREWLGAELAPMVVASADLRLAFPEASIEPGALREAVWRAHHARHQPALLGDDASQVRKRALLAEIASAESARERAEAFGAMHRLLAEVRDAREDRLVGFVERVRELERAMASRTVARSRDWPFTLYPRETMGEFARTIRECVASSAARSV